MKDLNFSTINPPSDGASDQGENISSDEEDRSEDEDGSSKTAADLSGQPPEKKEKQSISIPKVGPNSQLASGSSFLARRLLHLMTSSAN